MRDLEQISACVENYFQGMFRSDGALLLSAFHPGAMISGHTDGHLTEMDLDQFADFAAKQPSAAAAEDRAS